MNNWEEIFNAQSETKLQPNKFDMWRHLFTQFNKRVYEALDQLSKAFYACSKELERLNRELNKMSEEDEILEEAYQQNQYMSALCLGGLNNVQREALFDLDTQSNILTEVEQDRKYYDFNDIDIAELFYYVSSQVYNGMADPWYKIMYNSEFKPGPMWKRPESPELRELAKNIIYYIGLNSEPEFD